MKKLGSSRNKKRQVGVLYMEGCVALTMGKKNQEKIKTIKRKKKKNLIMGIDKILLWVNGA